MGDVKPSLNKMEQRSAETRTRVVRAAYDLFCAHGFRATTMEAIGSAAGVSVQTVYFQFRTKDQVLQAVHEWTVLGDEGLPPERQPWFLAALEHEGVEETLSAVVTGTASLNARIAPTLPIFATSAKEPQGEIYRESRRLRRAGIERLVKTLRSRRPLRAGLSPGRATDLADFLMGPESYAELVLHAGWSSRAWATWVTGSLVAQLFEGEEGG